MRAALSTSQARNGGGYQQPAEGSRHDLGLHLPIYVESGCSGPGEADGVSERLRKGGGSRTPVSCFTVGELRCEVSCPVRLPCSWLWLLVSSSACLDGGGEATPTRTAPEEKVGGSDDLHRPLDLPSVAPGTVGNAKLTFVTLILRAARYWPMDEDGA
jgi:hypothetical protein